MAGSIAIPDVKELLHSRCNVDTTLQKMHRKAKGAGLEQLLEVVMDAQYKLHKHPLHPENQVFSQNTRRWILSSKLRGSLWINKLDLIRYIHLLSTYLTFRLVTTRVRMKARKIGYRKT